MVRRLATLVLAVGALSSFAARVQAQEPTALRFTQPDSLSLEVGADTSKTVWLQSDGVSGDITWELLVDQGSGDVVRVSEDATEGAPGTLTVEGPDSAAADSVAGYRVKVAGLDADKAKGAQLVAAASGSAPAALDVELSSGEDLSPSLNALLLGPLVIALLFGVAMVATVGFSKLGDPVGTPNLDFSKSFATTLTAIGALLGTILSSGLIADDTAGVGKHALQGLNLVFAVLILVAPVVYLASQRRIETEDEKGETVYEEHGTVAALIVAGAITVWAVIGELATIYVLFEALSDGGEITTLGITVMQVILAAGALLAIAYSYRKLVWIANAAETASTGGEEGVAPRATAPQPSWTLL
jgi:hypothetical protein